MEELLSETRMDDALERLRAPTTTDERWEILRALVAHWHLPVGPEDGLAVAAGASVPAPLRRWYRWAGRRREILTGQNILFTPSDPEHPYWELREEDGHLLFHVENQAVYRWATSLDGEDPAVYGRHDTRSPWELEGLVLSEHLILTCLFEAVSCHALFGAHHPGLDGATLAALTRVLPPIALPPWRWGTTRFHARGGAAMYTMTHGPDYHTVWIGARTAEAVGFLGDFVDESWEYASV